MAAATLLSAALPVLSGQLLAVATGYVAARPCVADLLARALHIDAVVIALPASMQAHTAHKLPEAHVLQHLQSRCPPVLLSTHHRTDVKHLQTHKGVYPPKHTPRFC